MIRTRFYVNPDDYRPINWPPPGPYWCTGYALNNDFELSAAVVVAYVEREDQILEFWPDATEIDSTPDQEIIFTDRFSKPDWWTP